MCRTSESSVAATVAASARIGGMDATIAARAITATDLRTAMARTMGAHTATRRIGTALVSGSASVSEANDQSALRDAPVTLTAVGSCTEATGACSRRDG